ncbi:MAG: hypothetical protein RIQ31_687 [Actinomycetota bacterium]|jgi:uncharacterized membrane protein
MTTQEQTHSNDLIERSKKASESLESAAAIAMLVATLAGLILIIVGLIPVPNPSITSIFDSTTGLYNWPMVVLGVSVIVFGRVISTLCSVIAINLEVNTKNLVTPERKNPDLDLPDSAK